MWKKEHENFGGRLGGWNGNKLRVKIRLHMRSRATEDQCRIRKLGQVWGQYTRINTAAIGSPLLSHLTPLHPSSRSTNRDEELADSTNLHSE